MPSLRQAAEAFNAERVTKEAYHLSPELMGMYEAEIIDKLEESGLAPSGFAVILIENGDRYADFGRTSETLAFPDEDYDFHAGMRRYEKESVFLYTADLSNRAIAHTKRIVRAKPSPDGTTGLEVIDDRIRAARFKVRDASVEETLSREAADLSMITSFHNIKNLDSCYNVSTNQSTGRCPPGPHSIISYKGLFEYVETVSATHLLAYLNRKAIKSLGRLELDCKLLCDTEFHLPLTGKPGEYDTNYLAYCIPSTLNNINAFTKPDPKNNIRNMAGTFPVPLIWHNRVNQLMFDLTPPQRS
jgi:hypothetical protein